MTENRKPEGRPLNQRVVDRLKSAIEKSLPNQNPIFVVLGCRERGWVDFGLFYEPNPETEVKPQKINEVGTIIGSLEEQHDHECGSGHDLLPVLRRINESRQTEAKSEAINLVKLATRNLD